MSSAPGAIVAAVWFVLGSVVPPAPVPTVRPAAETPVVSATAWVLLDAATGEVIDGVNETRSLPMASVTKMMTALVVLEHLELDDRIRISETAAATGEAEIGLVPGERWSVRDLLYAVLVRSGNDAAVALAEGVAGSVEEFAVLMNAKGAELGLTGTAFVNPHGLDEEGHFASAVDLAVLGAAMMDDRILAEMARTRVVVFKDAPDGSARISTNTNQLLGIYPGIIGVKTGFTNDAGKVLVGAIDTADGRIVSVVMGSEDHFGDTRELLEYGRTAGQFSDVAQAALTAGLPTGRDQITELADTAIGREVADTLREMLPAVLGGTS